MANRRQFIQSGLALSAMSVPAASVLAAGALTPALRLERFVLDARFVQAASAAGGAASRGASIAAFSGGDLTALWYHDLDLRWKRRPMALAGVTGNDALFVLETLAADRGMRVVYRGEHAVQRTGRVTHALRGPAHLLAEAEAAPRTDGFFWPALGTVLTRCPLGKPAVGELEFATRPEDSTASTTFCSWIIAPRSAVAPTV